MGNKVVDLIQENRKVAGVIGVGMIAVGALMFVKGIKGIFTKPMLEQFKDAAEEIAETVAEN